MKIADSLLVAPLGFCLLGSVLGGFLDISFSRLCVAIITASIVVLGVYWLLVRGERRGRLRQLRQ